jgi:diadenosine tetraphosphate (Ap4A) HIT family hydrolase
MTDTAPKPCHICGMLEAGNNLIYSDGYFSAFALADRPGWVLYGCNRHGEWIWGLTDEEAEDLGRFVRSIAGAMKEATGTTHIYYIGLGENSLHYHGILAARHEPFAKDIQAALAARGGEVANQEAAARIVSAMREKLQAG